MPRKVNKISFSEGKARSTAWAVTFGDMVTLLLTFFILIIVIMNEAEKQIDQIIDMLLDETYKELKIELSDDCLLYTSPSPRDRTRSRMPSSA